MKISTAKTDIMCISRHSVLCSLQTNKVTLQQTEKFKYLEITILSDGRQDNELGTRIGKASAVSCQLFQSVVLKRKLCPRTKLSNQLLFLFSTNECCVMTKRVRSRVQATEMGFLQKVRGLFLFDKVKSTDIRQSVNIKLLLLGIKQSQLRLYGHVTRMSHERTAKQLMDALPSSITLRGRPRTC